MEQMQKQFDVVIWGSSVDYDRYAKAFSFEVLKGSMRIVAVVLNDEGSMQYLEGVPMLQVEELTNLKFDYLVDMNEEEHEAALHILKLLHVPLEKVIAARAFLLPTFDLRRWVQIQKSSISIISNNCWGGLTYHSLGLPFLSPFINLFMRENDYLTLLEDFVSYMQYPLRFVEERRANLEKNYPVMALGDVQLHFNHYEAQEEAAVIWEKRKQRLNYDNLLVEMMIETKEGLERFMALPFEHKMGLTMLPYEGKDVISFGKYPYYQQRFLKETWQLTVVLASWQVSECKVYDVLKLLNHEEDYRRIW